MLSRIYVLVAAVIMTSEAHAGAVGVDSIDRLLRIDLTTGAVTTGPPIEVPGFFIGIDFTPAGSLYGVTTLGALYRIDTVLGTASLIGAGSIATSEGDVSIDPQSGVLYAVGGKFCCPGPESVPLYRFDLTSGASTLVGALGMSPSALDPSGLAFGPDGSLIVMDTTGDRFLSIDPQTARVLSSVTARSETGSPFDLGPGGGGGLDYDPIMQRFVGIDTYGIFEADPETGVVTRIGLTSNVASGFALVIVPEPSTMMLVLVGAGLLGARRPAGPADGRRPPRSG